MSSFEVTITRLIHAPAARVWSVLTDPALVAEWMMGATVASTWEKGGPITWKGEYEGRPYSDSGVVLEVDPGRRLVHTHVSGTSGAQDDPHDGHRLEWTLDPRRDATELTLVQSGADSEQEADQFKQSWNVMLDALRATAEG